jgi:uncharacterized protein (DUF433 family)
LVEVGEAAASISARVASGRPKRMLSATLPENRNPFATVVAMVADGMTVDEILADLPYLEREEITEALRGCC